MKKRKRFRKYIFNLIKWVFIPLILLGFWVILSLTRNPSVPFSVLLHKSGVVNISESYKNNILKGSKVSGEFIAKDNYLGSISISFNPIDRIRYDEEDTLVFRIKEIGENEWYYENEFKSGLVHLSPDLPFGFPIITESKNKSFQFEIISLSGNKKNSISINNNSSNIVSLYQYPSGEISKDKTSLIQFMFKKLFNMFYGGNYFLYSFIYLLPFIIYLYLISNHRKKYLFLPVLILFECILIREVHNWVFWIITFLWIFSVWKFKLHEYLSFKIAFLFIIISFLVLLFDQKIIAEKFALWSYTFLAVGSFQKLIKFRFDKIGITK